MRRALAILQVIDDTTTILNKIERRIDAAVELDPGVVQNREARVEVDSFGSKAEVDLTQPASDHRVQHQRHPAAGQAGVPPGDPAAGDLQRVRHRSARCRRSAWTAARCRTRSTPPSPVCRRTSSSARRRTARATTSPGTDRKRDSGSVYFDASSRCWSMPSSVMKPATGTCNPTGEPDDSIELSGVSLRHLAFELNQGDESAANPLAVLLDTNGHPAVRRGRLRLRQVPGRARLPREQHRRAPPAGRSGRSTTRRRCPRTTWRSSRSATR